MLREALIVLALVGASLLAAAPPAAAGGTVGSYTLTLPTGEVGTGRLGTPAGTPTHLVVVMKGVNHFASHYEPHLGELADAGALGLAIDYPDFGSAYAARFATEATLSLLVANPSVETVVLYGVSGGLPGATLALANMPTKPGSTAPLFDYLVDVEGVSALHETYAEAKAASVPVPAAGEAAVEIEAECGAPAAPSCLAERSLVYRASDIAARGLRGAVVIHPVNDGLVPFNQGLEAAAALRAAGIPTDTIVVTRTAAVPDENDTAATEYATGPAGLPDVDLAGHASERNRDHTVVRTALDRTLAIVGGTYTPGSAPLAVADRELGFLAVTLP